MKTAIVYYSKHHGNTKKVLDAITQKFDITLIDAAEITGTNLDAYDVIGFASGIYYSKFHKSVLQFAQNNLPHAKKVFFLYTYGAEKAGYTAAISKVAALKNADILGEYGCLGYNTFGPFKLIGSLAKGHPNKDDLDGAVKFCERILG